MALSDRSDPCMRLHETEPPKTPTPAANHDIRPRPLPRVSVLSVPSDTNNSSSLVYDSCPAWTLTTQLQGDLFRCLLTSHLFPSFSVFSTQDSSPQLRHTVAIVRFFLFCLSFTLTLELNFVEKNESRRVKFGHASGVCKSDTGTSMNI